MTDTSSRGHRTAAGTKAGSTQRRSDLPSNCSEHGEHGASRRALPQRHVSVPHRERSHVRRQLPQQPTRSCSIKGPHLLVRFARADDALPKQGPNGHLQVQNVR
jgi:hypothetical protein